MDSFFSHTLAAILTIGIISFLYKDNPLYKFCESLFIGVSAGYWFVQQYYANLLPKLFDNLGITRMLGAENVPEGALQRLFLHREWNENLLYLIAGILGVMMLLRLVSKIGWISRWPMAFIVGSIAGLYFITYFQSNAMRQMQNTILPLSSFNNLVLIVGTVTGIIYFYFSKEHKGLFGGAARVGIYFLMVTFGASFGYTVMSRMSLLIGRIDFLFGTWLGLVR
jgi:hypothetical protein